MGVIGYVYQDIYNFDRDVFICPMIGMFLYVFVGILDIHLSFLVSIDLLNVVNSFVNELESESVLNTTRNKRSNFLPPADQFHAPNTHPDINL